MKMENAERNTEKPNSAEISISATGKWSGKVKAYATTIDSAYDQAVSKADLLEIYLKKKNEG